MTDNTILKTYIYASGQVLCRHDGDYSAAHYFYIHDRLGSTRQIINTSGSVVRYYTYEPFGEVLEEDGTLTNNMKFTGQCYDAEINQYYLRARQDDPHISRFTARDPVFGDFEEPLTLHIYLYCLNDPINKTDCSGEFIDLVGTMAIHADITGRELVAGGLAMGLAYHLLMANEARNALISALTYMTYEGETRPFPYKDKHNLGRILDEHMQRSTGDRPPEGPWGWRKIIYYLGKILEIFHKD